MIRVVLPPHLRTLAGVAGEVTVDCADPATWGAIVDALEARHPALRGTIREHGTQRRRPLVRFFACEQDWSQAAADAVLPAAVARGEEPFLIIGALAGG